MRKFEVTFIKRSSLLSNSMHLKQTATQIYHSETEKIRIDIPVGYEVALVNELLPDVTLSPVRMHDEKIRNHVNNEPNNDN